jgi:PAS domain S-box-containing protein
MKILFMSEEHSVKRKLAAQIAHHLAEDKAEIYQVKTAFDPIDHQMQSVLEEVEIPYNVDNIHTASDLSNESFDIVIMLCKCFRRKLLSFSGFPAVLYWPIDNPVRRGSAPHQITGALRKTRDDLLNRLKHFFEDGYLDAFYRQGNQLFDMLNDHSQGVIRFNREEIIISVNEQALNLSGYDQEALIGKPLHFLVTDDTVSRHALAVTDEGVAFRQTDLKLKRVDKELVKVRATFKALSRDRGLGGYLSFEESRDEPIIQPMEGTRGLDRLSWDRVEAALKQASGNRTKAARILGVGRATFYRFLEREKMQGRTPKTDLV